MQLSRVRFLAVIAIAALALAAVPAMATAKYSSRNVCGTPAHGTAACTAKLRLDAKGSPNTATPSGFGPADLQSAYALPSTVAGVGQVIGIVDAYDDPNAAQDLATYRAQFKLPPCSTSGTNPCFRKVGQTGSTRSLPHANGGWAQEEALDIDMASAICPNCRIVLVEANSASFANLSAAVNEAAALGATEISNSYGGSEFSGETDASTEGAYNHPGVAITVSSGDGGYGTEFPASSRYVTAVGGTSLKRDSTTSRGWSETAWTGAGSGCSAYVPKPGWQADTGCGNRTVADVSADADPYTGVSVYDSYSYQGARGWLVFGGTSVASPITAGVYALAGNASSLNAAQSLYTNASSLNDVTSGSNGTCATSYLCSAALGFDGPTGLGSPNGVTAF
jgi:subtilase family serine protease